MELGQLEALVEAQRRGSITRAAEALGLTQPTVTARLLGLERELGTPLLVRGRRGVTLTAAGRRFLPRAMAALEAVRRGVADTHSSRDARSGFLTLGLASDLALYLAPVALARFARTHPDVEVTVRSGRSRAVAEALRSDEIEIALVSQLVVLQSSPRGHSSPRTFPWWWAAPTHSRAVLECRWTTSRCLGSSSAIPRRTCIP